MSTCMGVCMWSSLTDLGRDEDDDEPVPLLNVNGAIMKKVFSCRSPEIVNFHLPFSPQCSLAPFSFALHPSLGN